MHSIILRWMVGAGWPIEAVGASKRSKQLNSTSRMGEWFSDRASSIYISATAPRNVQFGGGKVTLFDRSIVVHPGKGVYVAAGLPTLVAPGHRRARTSHGEFHG
jgi:hypothetical protein